MTLRELLKQNELHFPLMRIPYHTSLSEISEASANMFTASTRNTILNCCTRWKPISTTVRTP